ncbi:MAG: O-antigen ligase family protein [Anaerolineales bacterium]|nr:O-antigen ligase family protein [Anaerolineales bacterium]
MSFFWKTIPVPIHIRHQSLAARLFWIVLAITSGIGAATLPLTMAGLLIVGATVLVAILVEPLFGLTIMLLLGPFGALERILGQTILDSGQLLLIITLISWFARGIARREPLFKYSIPFSGVFRTAVVFLIAFLVVGGLSLYNAQSLTDGVKELIKWVQIGLVAWIVFDMTSRRGINVTLLAIIPAAITQAGTGIWQFGLRGHGPEHFEILGRFYRAYGTFEQPNPFAGFLGLTLPLAVGWGLGNGLAWLECARQKYGKENIQRLFSSLPALLKIFIPFGIAAVLFTALLMSWSRGGWLGAAAGLSAMLFFLPRRQWKGVAVVLIVLAIAGILFQTGLMPAALVNRLAGFTSFINFTDARGVDVTSENYSILERMAHWQSALRMADYNPWLGIGIGNYAAAYSDYDLLNWPYPLGHAHNIYLNMLAETGVLGLTAYLGFWISVIWLTVQIIVRSSYPQRGIALGLMGVWVHLTAHHVVDNLYVNNIYLHLGALLGILLFLWRTIGQNDGQRLNYALDNRERKDRNED